MDMNLFACPAFESLPLRSVEHGFGLARVVHADHSGFEYSPVVEREGRPKPRWCVPHSDFPYTRAGVRGFDESTLLRSEVRVSGMRLPDGTGTGTTDPLHASNLFVRGSADALPGGLMPRVLG